jgi:hypothetical protein
MTAVIQDTHSPLIVNPSSPKVHFVIPVLSLYLLDLFANRRIARVPRA